MTTEDAHDLGRREVTELIADRRLEEAGARLKAMYPLPDPYGGHRYTTGIMLERLAEQWAADRPEVARWCLDHAYEHLRDYLSWSTSGGEAAAREIDVRRVGKKLRAFGGKPY